VERQRGCSDSEAGRSVIVQSDRDVDELDERVGSDPNGYLSVQDRLNG
jgi:hypothetical protein